MLSHCLLSLPTVFMCCLPRLLYWLAQMLSENSRHLCEYFLEVHTAKCFKLFNLTFCRNPPNNTSIYATSLVSNFGFFSESMDLLLVPKVCFHRKTVGVHQGRFCGIQEAGTPYVNSAILPCFHVEQVSLKKTEKRGSTISWRGIKLTLCFQIFLGPDTPELKKREMRVQIQIFFSLS